MRKLLLLLATPALLPALLWGDDRLRQLSPYPLQAESTLKSLEPWETPISGFFIRSHHGMPEADESAWELTIDGLVEKPVRLSLAEIKRMRTRSLHAVLECSGNGRGLQKPSVPGLQWHRGAVGNAQWTGVSVAELLAKAGVKPNARFVHFEGADAPATPEVPGFIRSIPLAKLRDPDDMVALRMNREALSILHGGPLRLVLPGWYGQNWIKWLTRITLSEEEHPGFYMKKGYRMPKAPVKPGELWDSSTGAPIEEMLVQSLIVRPTPDQELEAGEIVLRGKAFSGAGTIAKVEISTDQGASWRPAQLEPPRPSGGWQEFSASLRADFPGSLTLLSRATDSAGHEQPIEHVWNPGGYLRNAVDRVTVSVLRPSSFVGREVLIRKCLMCHARELIEGQRLTSKQWEANLKKMEGFGARLESSEKEVLMEYLASLPAGAAPDEGRPIDFLTEEASLKRQKIPGGDGKRGLGLFAANCAACHGDKGEGKLAPRLAGRAIKSGDFALAVRYGKRSMPGFGDALGRREVDDIRTYLRNFVSHSRPL